MGPQQETWKKYHQIIESGKFEEREIISFRSLLREYLGVSNDVQALFDKFERLAPYDISEGQKRKGIEWLTNFFFKQDGTVRENKAVADIRIRTERYFETIIESVRNFKDFKLAGLTRDPNRGLYSPPLYFPVYKLMSVNNSGFEYSYINGNFIIMDINK